MNTTSSMRYLGCLILSPLLLLLSVQNSQAANSTERAVMPEQQEQTQDARTGLSIGDLVITTGETQLRKSKMVNNYNIIRLLSHNEIVTISNLQGRWTQVQTEGDEFGWVSTQQLQKVKYRTIITKDWTELIGSSIGAIRACTSALRSRKSATEAPRIIHIDPSLNTVTLTLFWDTKSSNGYRCTIGAYGGEVHRLQAFNRSDGKPSVMFSPTPGKPSIDHCYSNEIIFDRFRRTLGWLSHRIC